MGGVGVGFGGVMSSTRLFLWALCGLEQVPGMHVIAVEFDGTFTGFVDCEAVGRGDREELRGVDKSCSSVWLQLGSLALGQRTLYPPRAQLLCSLPLVLAYLIMSSSQCAIAHPALLAARPSLTAGTAPAHPATPASPPAPAPASAAASASCACAASGTETTGTGIATGTGTGTGTGAGKETGTGAGRGTEAGTGTRTGTGGRWGWAASCGGGRRPGGTATGTGTGEGAFGGRAAIVHVSRVVRAGLPGGAVDVTTAIPCRTGGVVQARRRAKESDVRCWCCCLLQVPLALPVTRPLPLAVATAPQPQRQPPARRPRRRAVADVR